MIIIRLRHVQQYCYWNKYKKRQIKNNIETSPPYSQWRIHRRGEGL